MKNAFSTFLAVRFATALMLMASPLAHAQWTEIHTFEDGMRVYVDSASARRDGDTGQLKHLVRWAEPQSDEGVPPYRSTLVRTEYDCAGKREKYLGSVSYSGPMADGPKVLADDNAAETWYSISDGSMEEKLWKTACKIK